jgi:hypothetical protein
MLIPTTPSDRRYGLLACPDAGGSAHFFTACILYKSLTKSGENGATASARAALLIARRQVVERARLD